MKNKSLEDFIKILEEQYNLGIALTGDTLYFEGNTTWKITLKTNEEKIAYLKGILAGVDDYANAGE